MSGSFGVFGDLGHDYFGVLAWHLRVALVPVLIGLLLALPAGWAAARLRRLNPRALRGTMVVYAVPVFAVCALSMDRTGPFEVTMLVSLTLYNLVVLVPAVAEGVRSVPEDALTAAMAMGCGGMSRFTRLELPVAVPAILSGLRVAAASSISLVAVSAFLGYRGVLDGLLAGAESHGRLVPAVDSVLLGLGMDVLLVLLGRLLVPWSSRSGGGAGTVGPHGTALEGALMHGP